MTNKRRRNSNPIVDDATVPNLREPASPWEDSSDMGTRRNVGRAARETTLAGKDFLRLLLDLFAHPSFADLTDKPGGFTYADLGAWVAQGTEEQFVALQGRLNMSFSGRSKNAGVEADVAEIVMAEMNVERAKQIVRLALPIAEFSRQDERIGQWVEHCILSGIVPQTFLIGCNMLPSPLQAPQRGEPSAFVLAPPETFEVLMYFQALSIIRNHNKNLPRRRIGDAAEEGNEAARVPAHRKSTNRACYVVQVLYHAWTDVAFAAKFSSFEELMAPYIIFDSSEHWFDVLDEGLFAPIEQKLDLYHDKAPLSHPDGYGGKVETRTSAQHSAFRYLVKKFFDRLQFLIVNPDLYTWPESDRWGALEIYLSSGNPDKLPAYFDTLDEDVMAVLRPAPQAADAEKVPKPVDDTPTRRNTGERGLVPSTRHTTRLQLGPGRTSLTAQGPSPPSPSPHATEEQESEGQALAKDFLSKMSQYCRVYDVPFEDLVSADESREHVPITGNVQLILTDPPYNVRRKRNDSNSSYDRLTAEDMQASIEVFDELLRPGGHGIVFCSVLQFYEWFHYLETYKGPQSEGPTDAAASDDGSDEEEVTSMNSDSEASQHSGEESADEGEEEEEDDVVRNSVFFVDEVPLLFVRLPGHLYQMPGRKRYQRMNMAEVAIHFWKRGVPFKTGSEMVAYRNHGYMDGTYPAWCNVTINMPAIDSNEMVWRTRSTTGATVRVRAEQKSVALMMELISQHSQPGDIVVDPFSGTFATGKAAMSLPEHRVFVGSDMDKLCVARSLPKLCAVMSRVILSNNTDMRVTTEAKQSAEKFLASPSVTMRTQRERRIIEPPPGLPLYQRFPKYIRQYLWQLCPESIASHEHMEKPVHYWPPSLRRWLQTENPRVMRAHDCVAKKLSVRPSLIKHPNAGRGLFAEQTFNVGDEVCAYYGTVVYSDMSKESMRFAYGEGNMAITKERFLMYAIKLYATAEDDENIEHPIWIVPAPFCSAQFINDPRYLRGEDTPAEDTRRMANVEFVENYSSGSTGKKLKAKDLENPKIIVVRAIRDIRPGQELYVHYGTAFRAWN